MKITVKTTQQKVFQVDVDGSDTIADLKAKIHESQGHPVAVQKIIYSGKILTDDKSVESCGIKEKDFLVLMVSKPKPTPASTSSTSTPASEASIPATPSQPPTAAPAAVPEAVAEAPQVAPSAPAAFGDPSAFLSGDGLQAAINNMVEMGFPRDQVLRAMRASFNNADRAVEYLMTGIPSHLEAEAPRQPADAPASTQPQATPAAAAPPSNQPQDQPQNLFQLAQQQHQAGGGAPATGGAAGGAHGAHLNLEALRDNPQIQQLRQQMAQNPALIQPLIQQLASQNPAIAQMIAQNPEALFQLLGIELDESEEGGPVPPGAHVVSVTEEERAAIQRLEALGFPRQAVLEAYFACDKNEELAANYLFESGFDD
jgi:UV excision repair protein RAD23